MRFEHDVIPFAPGFLGFDFGEMTRRLDKAAADGWEVISVVSTSKPEQLAAFLRRPISPRGE